MLWITHACLDLFSNFWTGNCFPFFLSFCLQHLSWNDVGRQLGVEDVSCLFSFSVYLTACWLLLSINFHPLRLSSLLRVVSKFRLKTRYVSILDKTRSSRCMFLELKSIWREVDQGTSTRVGGSNSFPLFPRNSFLDSDFTPTPSSLEPHLGY